MIHFETKPFVINSWTIILLPKDASAELPSRSPVMVAGTVNGAPIRLPVEPDGNGSHWFRVDDNLAGEAVTVELEATKDWSEPPIPADWQAALEAHPQQYDLWKKITPMARWEWIRWIQCSPVPETRQRHIEVSISKLSKGMRRPCCFNRAMCCVPEVSKGGVLLAPSETA